MPPLEPPVVPFSGSYAPQDVTFLLTPTPLETVPVEDKERLIQSGQHHYSELLSPEHPPSETYLRLYEAALERNGGRVAQDLHRLADHIGHERRGSITLLSLARGGTPIGVLLRRELERRGRQVRHFSLSILRDRGLDENALRWLLEAGYAAQTWTFVDGWSAKGVIADELRQSLEGFAWRCGVQVPPELFVLSDLSGRAAFAATHEDYLIPSSLLNATVSGLISRTVLPRKTVPDSFHRVALLEHLREHDRSRAYVDDLWARMLEQREAAEQRPDEPGQQDLQPGAFVEALMRARGLPRNHIKPGIGEATRVMLRRLPERLLLRDPQDPEVAHLLHLAQEKGVPTEVRPEMPYRACALIARLETAET